MFHLEEKKKSCAPSLFETSLLWMQNRELIGCFLYKLLEMQNTFTNSPKIYINILKSINFITVETHFKFFFYWFWNFLYTVAYANKD